MNSVQILDSLKVKIYADGADLASIRELAANPRISGFTTNPTLMYKAGVRDYRRFARDVLEVVSDRPISFEVFLDDASGMERQALDIATWASNVYVKIPVTNTSGRPTYDLIERLTTRGVQVNVTAVLTVEQVSAIAACLDPQTPSYISVFAGRIADTGRDPQPVMADAVKRMRRLPNAQLIWASPRELLNIMHADQVGCHVITVTSDLLNKLPLLGKSLDEYSLETVQMFHADAQRAGFCF